MVTFPRLTLELELVASVYFIEHKTHNGTCSVCGLHVCFSNNVVSCRMDTDTEAGERSSLLVAQTVRAIYSFQGENNDELCVEKGDLITLTQTPSGNLLLPFDRGVQCLVSRRVVGRHSEWYHRLVSEQLRRIGGAGGRRRCQRI